jgi:ferredoxin/flavodoxin
MIIYFFTGTGNSLKIAKDLCIQLKDCELTSIINAIAAPTLKSKFHIIGFVFPLYYSGLPHIVYKFIENLDVSEVNYAFAVVNGAGDPNGIALEQVNALLVKKSKILNAGFFIRMPNNYIIGYDIDNESEQEMLFENERKEVEFIVETVTNSKNFLNLEKSERKLKKAHQFNANFRKKVNISDDNFSVDENCTNCGICEQICPVSNIKLVQGIPKWQHHCEQCLACINFCPERAIQFNANTMKFGRYHHPEVSIKDIMQQKAD